MRLIDADALIADIRKNSSSYFADDFAHEWVDKQPTILPTVNPDGWIPCEDRLPEDEYVLISKKPTKISGNKWSVAIAIRTADPRSRKIQWRDSGFGVIQDDKVLAWMPLPPAYEPKEDTQ